MKSIRVFTLLALYAAVLSAQVVLTPKNVVEMALKNNRQLKAAEWGLKKKEEGKKEAAAGLFPKISGTAYYRKNSEVPSFDLGPLFGGFGGDFEMGSTDNYSVGLNVAQPIFTGFKLINSIRLADAAHNAKASDKEKTEQLVAYGAVALFWTAYMLEQGAGVARDAETQLKKLSEDQQKMYEQKMIAEHDLVQIKASFTKAKVEVIKTGRQYRRSLRSLVNFLDLEPSTEITLSAPEAGEAALLAENLNAYIEHVKKTRPDLQQSRETENMLSLAEKMAKSNYLPNVSASFDYTYARPNQAVGFEDEWAGSWSIMVIAQWNLFDWGSAYRKGKQAEYQKKALEEINKAQERGVVSEAIDAWESVEESRKEYSAAREATVAAELNYNATKLKYEQGMVTTFEFLTAQSSLTGDKFSELNGLVKLKLALENMKIGGLGANTGGR